MVRTAAVAFALVLSAPVLAAGGQYELVVHWPGASNAQDYRRVFTTKAACDRALNSVVAEAKRREDAAQAQARSRGGYFIGNGGPFAVCVPLG